MRYDKAQLRKASLGWIGHADAVLNRDQGHQHAAPYLAHLALECSLKARILEMAKVSTVDEFVSRQGPETGKRIFSTKAGHSLDLLAEQASVRRLLVASGSTPALLDDSAPWRRLNGPDRPYSLRYGAERVAPRDARVEVELVQQLMGILEENRR
jgi:hypothetical protein